MPLIEPTLADELMEMSQKDVEKGWKFLEGRAAALEPCKGKRCRNKKKAAKKK